MNGWKKYLHRVSSTNIYSNKFKHNIYNKKAGRFQSREDICYNRIVEIEMEY